MPIELPKIQQINKKRKDVGVCTFAYSAFRPSHCPHFRISNPASPRQDDITQNVGCPFKEQSRQGIIHPTWTSRCRSF